MKRAIYVGLLEEYPYQWPRRHILHYGMTGDVSVLRNFCSFRPDGSKTGSYVNREDIYIKPEDFTQHRPKP